MQHLMRKRRCRMQRCALPRARNGRRKNELPARARQPLTHVGREGTSLRWRSRGRTRTSTCSAAAATRSWLSATPSARFTWQACWPTRNFRLPIPTSPRRFWCPAFTARADANAEEKSYFGADASQYDQRSAFPGILNIKTPLLLAWSTQDPPRLVAEGETLKQRLCNSVTHCPRTTVLGNRESLASCLRPVPRAAAWLSRR